MSKHVKVGIIGAGFAAHFHLASYRKVYGESFEVAGICGRSPGSVEALAERYGIKRRFASIEAMLRDPDIDVVDICVPNHLHLPLVLEAARHGKHIICEKPLGGYFGPPGAGDDWSAHGASRQEMLDTVVQQARAVQSAIAQAGVTFCYGENWVYAPPVVKVDRLLAASGSTIMRIEGEESHSGSHSPYALRWRTAGGGSLLRLCVHPIGAALHLKYQEGRRRSGMSIRPVSVVAQVANLTAIPSFRDETPKHVTTGWVDVEDWATNHHVRGRIGGAAHIDRHPARGHPQLSDRARLTRGGHCEHQSEHDVPSLYAGRPIFRQRIYCRKNGNEGGLVLPRAR